MEHISHTTNPIQLQPAPMKNQEKPVGGPVRQRRKRRQRSPESLNKIKKERRFKANDRERSRMHGLNDALDELRAALPGSGEDGKLTKIETLRFAVNYMHSLKYMIDEDDFNRGLRPTRAIPPEPYQPLSECQPQNYQPQFLPVQAKYEQEFEPLPHFEPPIMYQEQDFPPMTQGVMPPQYFLPAQGPINPNYVFEQHRPPKLSPPQNVKNESFSSTDSARHSSSETMDKNFGGLYFVQD